MKLVIAEKPSVARSIAAVIGATDRQDGYLQGNGYIVSWCIGHLVSFADAGMYDERFKKWRYEDLPIIPESWRLTVPPDKRERFDTLRTGGRIDLPHSLPPGGLYQAHEAAVDFQHGGQRHPGGLRPPETGPGL